MNDSPILSAIRGGVCCLLGFGVSNTMLADVLFELGAACIRVYDKKTPKQLGAIALSLQERGVEFFAVNSNYPDEEVDRTAIRSRKLKADLFIDDCQVGGLPDWGVIYELISTRTSYADYLRQSLHLPTPEPQNRSLWSKLFGKKE